MEQGVLQNRAFVHVNGLTGMWSIDGASGLISWAFHPTWVNSGDTQAKEMKTCVNAELLPNELPAKFAFVPQTQMMDGFIGPKSSILGGNSRQFTVKEMTDVRDGKLFLYVWGSHT